MATIIAFPTQDQAQKKKEENKKKAKATNRGVPASNLLKYETPELRNKSIGYDPELDRGVAEAELEILRQNLDISELNTETINNQRQVLEKVEKDFKAGKYFLALSRLVRENIQMTTRMLWMFLRLNRVYQGYRSGTTDMMEMGDAREILKNKLEQEQIINFVPGAEKDRSVAEMVVRNVAVGRKGTTEVGLDELKSVHSAVGKALRTEITDKYEDILPPHGLSGLETPGTRDQNPLRDAGNEKINQYLRLYEILTVELFNKEQQAAERDGALKTERAQAAGSLGKLAKYPNISLATGDIEGLKNKISVMDLGQLKYFDFKILELYNRLAHNPPLCSAEDANLEISSWFNKSFSHEELTQELAERKQADKKQDDADLTMERNYLAKIA